MATFKALRVVESPAGAFANTIESISFDLLPDHDVRIRVFYAALNYKDALSASGHKGITRSFPHTPGIDAAGVVESSRDARFQPGMKVLVTSYDLGMNTHGAFSEYIQVPGDWIVPLPDGLDLWTSMVLGTAGLTAGMSLYLMERAGQHPDMGPVLVTGASGGVGSLALAILKRAGYVPWAGTGSPQNGDYLKKLGTDKLLDRLELVEPRKKPLFSGGWGGAIDTVGGETLANLIKGCGHYGSVAVCGLVGSDQLSLSVYPFFMKGIQVLGVESAEYPMPERLEIWNRLASVWKPQDDLLNEMGKPLSLDEIPAAIQDMLKGQTQGRIIADMHP